VNTVLRPGLRVRFALGMAALVIAVIAVAALLVYRDQGAVLRRGLKQHGQKVALLLARSLSEPLAAHDYQAVQELIESVAREKTMYVVVMDDDGRILAHSDAKRRGDSTKGDLYADRMLRHFRTQAWLHPEFEQEVVLREGRALMRFHEFAARIRPSRRSLGFVRVGFDMQYHVDDPIADTQQRLALIVMGGLVVALLLAMGLANLIIRPLNRLVQEAGMLAAGRFDHPLALDAPGELENLAVAFETMRKAIQLQVQTIESANRQLDRKVFEMEILYEVSRNLNFKCYSPELLHYILDVTLKALKCQWGSLMLLSDDGERLEVRMVRGTPFDPSTRPAIPVGSGIAGQAFRTGEPVIANDGAKDPRFHELQGQKEFESTVYSLASAPLMVDRKPIGAINVVNKTEGDGFTADDARLLIALAGQAGRALESAKLYDQAIREPKTGLFVLTYFEARVQEQIIASKRFGHGFALIILDVDHFKRVNDSFGHMVGDIVLVRVAKFIQESLRQEIDIACRFGGEEFIVLLPRTDAAGATAFAERLRLRIEQEAGGIPEGPDRVTSSFGISVFPEHGRDIGALKGAADAALYRAKSAGRNNVQLAEPREKTGEA
jgi:diguanylate cyclase (GGDEF)-like protein